MAIQKDAKPRPASTAAILSPGASDFTILSAPKKQANLYISGEGGQGKTSFVTRYAPDPIACINVDRRDQQAIYEALQMGRRILRTEVDFRMRLGMTTDDLKLTARACLDRTIANMEWAIEESLKGNIRSIFIDTGTELSEIMKIAFDGTRDKTKEGAFGKDTDYVNQEWWRLFNLARQGQAHFIVATRSKEIWKDNGKGFQVATGKHTYRAPHVIHDASDWGGLIRLKKGLGGQTKKKWELEIIKAGVNISQLGAVYDEEEWGDMGPFAYACYQQYINTSNPEDWQ